MHTSLILFQVALIMPFVTDKMDYKYRLKP